MFMAPSLLAQKSLEIHAADSISWTCNSRKFLSMDLEEQERDQE
tara:strand:+ start:121 stop:252 length:132 start_codon:yes stop_codon:yes gene_type:complete